MTVNGKTVDLSPREFSLLEALLRHPNQTLTRDQLLDHAWPFSVAVTPNAVDAYVHYLRTSSATPGRRSRPCAAWGTASQMADGVRLEARDDDAEQAALGDEARLIRRVRWRLVAWSGVSTLVVLLVLGATLYAVTASTLAGASITQLDNRVDPWVARLAGHAPTATTGRGSGSSPATATRSCSRSTTAARRSGWNSTGKRACRADNRPLTTHQVGSDELHLTRNPRWCWFRYG